MPEGNTRKEYHPKEYAASQTVRASDTTMQPEGTRLEQTTDDRGI